MQALVKNKLLQVKIRHWGGSLISICEDKEKDKVQLDKLSIFY